MVDNVKLKQILDVLDQLAEDTSVPATSGGATDAKGRLLQTDEAMDVKAASATSILDELANDIPTFRCMAVPSYGTSSASWRR